MTRSALALLLLTSIAAADEQREELVARERPSCKATGAVWFQLDHVDATPKSEQSSAKLYANGATTLTRKAGGRETVSQHRCLVPREMSYVERLLKDSPWKSSRPKNASTCKATSPKSTVVRVFGKKVFTEAVCSADALDEKSAKALEELKAKLPKALPAECLDNPLAKGCD